MKKDLYYDTNMEFDEVIINNKSYLELKNKDSYSLLVDNDTNNEIIICKIENGIYYPISSKDEIEKIYNYLTN